MALTFDACSTWQATGYDPEVIEILKNTETPATLFLSGLWVLRYSQETVALHENDLFELDNHPYSHPDLTRHEPSVIRQELGYTHLIRFAVLRNFSGQVGAPHTRCLRIKSPGRICLPVTQDALHASCPLKGYNLNGSFYFLQVF